MVNDGRKLKAQALAKRCCSLEENILALEGRCDHLPLERPKRLFAKDSAKSKVDIDGPHPLGWHLIVEVVSDGADPVGRSRHQRVL